jgi:hypothetical protein
MDEVVEVICDCNDHSDDSVQLQVGFFFRFVVPVFFRRNHMNSGDQGSADSGHIKHL